jgi:23S rRNA (guanosine2251-2'-O)-methyltransferase
VNPPSGSSRPSRPSKGGRGGPAGPPKGRRPSSPKSSSPKSSSPKSSSRGGKGARVGGKGGAGRTGPVRPSGGRPGDPRVGGRTTSRGAGAPSGKSPGKSLGGEQVEGRQAVRELLIAQRRKVHEIQLASDLEDDEAVEDIVALARANRVPVAYVARKKLETAARSEAPQGVLARAASIPEVELSAFLRRRSGRSPFLVAIDSVTDPGNLGAIIRTCDGAGVDGVILPRHRAVHVTPTVAKAAAGAVEHVPIALVGGLPAALAQVRDAGIWVVGLDDAADRDLFDLGDLASEGICLVLGAEGAGLSRLVRERCDLVVSIPMRGRVSSLNVAAAAALATYEVARRRA